MIFEELQQNKKQVSQIVEWINLMKDSDRVDGSNQKEPHYSGL